MTQEIATQNPQQVAAINANPMQMERTNINVLENLRAQAESWEAAEFIAGKLVNTAAAGPFKGKPQDLAAAVLKGASLGIPAEAIGSSIYVVHGTPALYGKTALQIARAHGYTFDREEFTPQSVTVRAYAPNGDSQVTTYTYERATREGLVKGNKAQYETRPEKMLYWKCIGELADQFFPHLLNGMPIKEDWEQSPSIKMTATRVASKKRGASGLAAALSEPANQPPAAAIEEKPAETSIVDQLIADIGKATSREDLDEIMAPTGRRTELSDTDDDLVRDAAMKRLNEIGG
ncbi:hypothetical protein [Corynebacterium vitaeruminis]|uniref:hypothetical protein n=1 Tax=Corynebacterium vitaeruminis TaxID=38305 RepID=UPI0023F519D5|nr:hypothetical protein [Corynebacterium vitaeruminis]